MKIGSCETVEMRAVSEMIIINVELVAYSQKCSFFYVKMSHGSVKSVFILYYPSHSLGDAAQHGNWYSLSICTIEPLMNYHSSPWAPKWLYKTTAPVSGINTGPLWRSVATATIWSVLPVGGFGDGTEGSSVVATLWPTQTLPTLCPTL